MNKSELKTKTKVYLIISIVVQIVLAIYSIFSADIIIEEQMLELQEIFNMIPEMQDQITAFVMTTTEIIVMSSLNIILNIIAAIIVIKNNIIKRKGSLIAIYIACLLTTSNSLASWLAIINIIVLACIKRENEKFSMKQAEQVLKVESKTIQKKQIFLIIVLLIAYLLQLVPSSVLPESKMFLIIWIAIIYATLLVLSLVIFAKEIKQGIKIIKSNFKVYLKYILRVFCIVILFYLIANVITMLTTKQATSVNQETLESLPILFTAPAAIFWAPIVEESVFRGSIRKGINNNILFIIISSIIFGALHAVGEATLGIAIATAIPYAILGGMFAYIYAKTNNLACCMFLHSMYNALGVVLVVLK